MQIAKNNFTEGLVMDMSPEVTLNNCLTNALNATYITMNGNELLLLNDMGNAKFGAYLPGGYIPLGTTLLGGVVYVISYNPSNNKTLIGSFPSPQTEFMPSTDMGDVSIDPTYFNTNLLYKKVYDDVLMLPGDKFVFYFPTKTEELYKLYLYKPTYFPSGRLVIPNNHVQTVALLLRALRSFIKMNIYTISLEGKLLPLDLRKSYAIPNDNSTTAYVPVESDYNVYSSPVSGNLALVLSKVFCDNTTLQMQVLEDPDDNEIFILKFRYTFLSLDKFFFEKVYFAIDNSEINLAGGYLTYDDKYTSEMTMASDDLVATWYRNAERTMYKLSYSITLFKEDVDGKDAYLEILPFRFGKHVLANKTTKLIDISRLGTGDVLLSQYLYKFLDKEIQILFGFDTFLNVNESIKDITINIYESNNDNPIVSSTVSPETSSYTVSTNVVNMNNVYITEFVVHILQESGDDETEDTIRDVTITRWLITIDLLFDESLIDYDDKTTIYYWEKSRNTELTLGQDTIEADYSNAWSLKEGKEPITLTEKHTFKYTNVQTIIDYDSNVKNVVLNKPSIVAIPQCDDPRISVSATANTLQITVSAMQATVSYNCHPSTNYTILGLINQKQTLNGKYAIKRLYDIDHNRFTPCVYDQYDIHWDSTDTPILKAPGASDICLCRLFAGNFLQGGYPIFDTGGVPYPLDSYYPNKTLQGIYIRNNSIELPRILITSDKIATDYSYLIKATETISRNLCVGFPNSEDIYYCIDTASSSTKIEQVESLQIETRLVFLKKLSFDLLIQNKTIESYMDNFNYNGTKPKNLKLNWELDKSRTSQITSQEVTLPNINVTAYATITNDVVFLHGNAIDLVDNQTDNQTDNFDYTNKYKKHALFYTKDLTSVALFKGTKITINGITFNPNGFRYNSKGGYLLVGGYYGTVTIKNNNHTKEVCYIDINNTIQ